MKKTLENTYFQEFFVSCMHKVSDSKGLTDLGSTKGVF